MSLRLPRKVPTRRPKPRFNARKEIDQLSAKVEALTAQLNASPAKLRGDVSGGMLYALKRRTVGTLRLHHGPGFAAGRAATDVVADVIHALDQPSFDKLRRDYENGRMVEPFAEPASGAPYARAEAERNAPPAEPVHCCYVNLYRDGTASTHGSRQRADLAAGRADCLEIRWSESPTGESLALTRSVGI